MPQPEIEARLGAVITAERADGLCVAKEWIGASIGVGIEDVTVTNDRPVRGTATDILAWLGWFPPA